VFYTLHYNCYLIWNKILLPHLIDNNEVQFISIKTNSNNEVVNKTNNDNSQNNFKKNDLNISQINFLFLIQIP